MDPLFSLPVEIWRDQILILLDLVDVINASNSFASHKIQMLFFTLMDGCTLRDRLYIAPSNKKKVNWALTRNILSTNVSIAGDLDLQTASLLSGSVARSTIIVLSSCSIQLIEPKWSPRLIKLQVCVCETVSLGNLSVCPSFTTLVLHFCFKISAESLLESLSGCSQLESFTMRGCDQIKEQAIASILMSHPRLNDLDIGGNNRSYDLALLLDMTERQVFKSVRTIDTTLSTTVCSAGMRRLPAVFPQLQKLHLQDNTSNVSDADIDFLCKNCPCLSDLSFREFKFFTSAALLSIARYLPMLEKFSVFECGEIDDEGVISLAKGCVRLHSLRIYHCNNITDKSVQQVWLHCTLLEDFCLRGCSQITDAAFGACVHTTLRELNVCETRLCGCFIKQAPNLRTLHCDSSINSTFTQTIAAQPNTIQHLWINKARLSASALLVLSSHLPRVESVSLRESNATEEVVHSFVASCPRLQWLDVKYSAAVTKAVANELYGLYPVRKFKIYV